MGKRRLVIDESLLRSYYLTDKLTVQQCADKFGCSSKPIRDAIIRYCIPKRGKSESLKILYTDKTNHPKYGTHWSYTNKKRIGKSQPNKDTHICYNTGRTRFKENHICTPAMIMASRNNARKLHSERQEYLNSKISEAWENKYDYMVSTRVRGNKHPLWNENLDFYKRARNWLNNIYKWNQKIFERDNYTCWFCGKKGIKLNAHHVYPFNQIIKDFIDERGENMEELKLHNVFINTIYGITLCEVCHKSLHQEG